MAKGGRPTIECTENTLKEISSDLQGMTIPMVAEKHGVSVPTMNKWIRKAKEAGYITRTRVGNEVSPTPLTHQYLFDKELLHSLRRFLVRSFYDFSFSPSMQEGKAVCTVAVDQVKFSQIIGRVYCEKKSKEDQVLYMTPDEDASVYFVSCMHELHGASSHMVINIDPFSLFEEVNTTRNN